MPIEVIVFILVGIPLVAVCLGLTLRLGVQPIVEAFAKGLHDSTRMPSGETENSRLLEMREQIHVLTERVAEIATAVEFDRQLTGTRGTDIVGKSDTGES